MSEVLIAFRAANGSQTVVSAANPLPTGAATGTQADMTATNALLQALIDRIGAPGDALGAHTLIGLLKKIEKNTRGHGP